MKRTLVIEACPFAQPAPPSSPTAEAFYCRLPGGRVHIPSPESVQRFCATSRYTECPVNRRWMKADRS